MLKLYFQRILVVFSALTLFNFTSYGQSVAQQSFSVEGYDDEGTQILVNNPSSFTVNQGQPIQSITISDFYVDGYYCGDWYAFSLVLDGTTVVTEGCEDELIGQDVTGASSIVILYEDIDGYSDEVAITVEFEVTYETPSCLAPTNGIVSTFSSSSGTITWVAGDSETSWIVEWGVPGFTLGNGIGSQTVSTPSVSISGLDASTEYEVKIIADCGAGDESFPLTVSLTTSCEAIPAMAFCEGFEADSPTWSCWNVIDGNNDEYYSPWGDYTDYKWVVEDYEPNTGLQSAYIYANYYDNDDYLISPRVILSGNEVMTFSYNTYSGFKVLISTTGINPSDFTELLAISTDTDYEYESTSIDLSAYNGEVFFAFYVDDNAYGETYIDDVCIDICTPVAGIGGTHDVCRDENVIDLNSMITSQYTHGVWKSETLQSLISGSDLTISPLTEGTYTFNYIVTTACTSDTTVAIINIKNPSSAGENGLLTVCKNQLVDLFGALSGNVNYGGTWYNPSNVALTGSSFQTGTTPGQSVYKYVVSNGVCDPDTANVIVNILSCDFLSIEEAILENISLSPNPNNGLFQITGLPAGNDFSVEITDVNGRIVSNNVVANNTTMNVDLTHVETGIYLVKISGLESNKIIRVVKQ